ncbi:hypothetical protein CYMTET_55814 [Cymbomonas tetramitiformis]|uniref:DNA 3'-5' helicase n=1 Tax=Cymbomonas tetramitiformis TaxID=36881 RepID=A0AAE0EN78_9CHLO|nr:hypothetical protein CYMTET_55814 [Cymbomonas tetramitiformis]
MKRNYDDSLVRREYISFAAGYDQQNVCNGETLPGPTPVCNTRSEVGFEDENFAFKKQKLSPQGKHLSIDPCAASRSGSFHMDIASASQIAERRATPLKDCTNTRCDFDAGMIYDETMFEGVDLLCEQHTRLQGAGTDQTTQPGSAASVDVDVDSECFAYSTQLLREIDDICSKGSPRAPSDAPTRTLGRPICTEGLGSTLVPASTSKAQAPSTPKPTSDVVAGATISMRHTADSTLELHASPKTSGFQTPPPRTASSKLGPRHCPADTPRSSAPKEIHPRRPQPASTLGGALLHFKNPRPASSPNVFTPPQRSLQHRPTPVPGATSPSPRQRHRPPSMLGRPTLPLTNPDPTFGAHALSSGSLRSHPAPSSDPAGPKGSLRSHPAPSSDPAGPKGSLRSHPVPSSDPAGPKGSVEGMCLRPSPISSSSTRPPQQHLPHSPATPAMRLQRPVPPERSPCSGNTASVQPSRPDTAPPTPVPFKSVHRDPHPMTEMHGRASPLPRQQALRSPRAPQAPAASACQHLEAGTPGQQASPAACHQHQHLQSATVAQLEPCAPMDGPQPHDTAAQPASAAAFGQKLPRKVAARGASSVCVQQRQQQGMAARQGPSEHNVEAKLGAASSLRDNEQPNTVFPSVASEPPRNHPPPAAKRLVKGSAAAPELNPQQQRAIESCPDQPLLVLAGPGSGKTSVITRRLVHILRHGSPSGILALTFTAAGAQEMSKRVKQLINDGDGGEDLLHISTFHSFCLQLCREHAKLLERTSEFTIFGRQQQRKVAMEAARIEGLACLPEEGERAEEKKAELHWEQVITRAKSEGKGAEDLEAEGKLDESRTLHRYQELLKKCNALDLHDFVNGAVQLLEKHSEEVAEACQRKWSHVLVDEFQDTSSMQYKLLKFLASHRRVTAVGDDDQCIFAFNGSNVGNFAAFRADFGGGAEVRLESNYRSTGTIVAAAQALIRSNESHCAAKKVVSEQDSGESIRVLECRTEQTECSTVLDSVLASAAAGTRLSEISILYRRQVTGRAFQEALLQRGIPFNLHGTAVYHRKAVRDAVAVMWAILLEENGESSVARRAVKALLAVGRSEAKKIAERIEKMAAAEDKSFLATARSLFGCRISGTLTSQQLIQGRKALQSLKVLRTVARQEQSLSALVHTVVAHLPQRGTLETKAAAVNQAEGKLLNEVADPRSLLEVIMADVNDFLRSQNEGGGIEERKAAQVGCAQLLRSFLNHLALREAQSDRDRQAENKNAITLTTMHQSKGLEWDEVYVVRLSDNEIPLVHESSRGAPASTLEEERRLFYVSMTRARRRLILTFPVFDPRRQPLSPTRFLKAIPRALLDWQSGIFGTSVKRQAVVHPPTSTTDAGCATNVGVADSAKASVGTEAPPMGLNSDGKEGPTGSEYMFLQRFNSVASPVIAKMFHKWAKMQAFQEPNRLLTKVSFILDQTLSCSKGPAKEGLQALRSELIKPEAFLFAEEVRSHAP